MLTCYAHSALATPSHEEYFITNTDACQPLPMHFRLFDTVLENSRLAWQVLNHIKLWEYENIGRTLINLLKLLVLLLINTHLIKDTEVLSNFQALLTKGQKCGTICTLHKLHMFNRWRENTLVKSVFSLSSHLQRSGICVATMRGMHFFGAFLLGRTFLCADEVNVWVKTFPKRL